LATCANTTTSQGIQTYVKAERRLPPIMLRRIEGVDVEVTDGHMGEFIVLMDGVEVARKDKVLPSVEQIVSAVKDVAVVQQSV
jgi:hypothetical protein